MSNEEAILVLQNDAYVLYEDDMPYDRQAYYMAIKALKEQKHGQWKKAYLDHEAFGIRPTVVYCSECNLIGYWEPKYCPNCGARMDGDSDV